MAMDSPSTLVVALGGNALIEAGQQGTVQEQFANTRRMLTGLYDLLEAGHRVVLTHGNGPQVGAMLIRVELSEPVVPGQPLGMVVADTEGSMGYMIGQSLQNGLHRRGIQREVATVLTQVVVDREDPSLKNPTKPVGPFYSREQAEERMRGKGWAMVEDAGRGWRRVVPSPMPLEVVEGETIRRLADSGVIVVAGGGGGIPVQILEDGTLEGVDAVVDKDLTSLVLARRIEADVLMILTAVPEVSVRFGQPDQRGLRNLSVQEARCYMEEGHFPPGSMGPKVRACIEFLEAGGSAAIITSAEHASAALTGQAGTTFRKENA